MAGRFSNMCLCNFGALLSQYISLFIPCDLIVSWYPLQCNLIVVCLKLSCQVLAVSGFSRQNVWVVVSCQVESAVWGLQTSSELLQLVAMKKFQLRRYELHSVASQHDTSNPITRLDRPWGFQEVEVLRFQDIRHMKVVMLSAVRTGRHYRPWNTPGTHFC